MVEASGVPGFVGCVSGGPSMVRVGVVLKGRARDVVRIEEERLHDYGSVSAMGRMPMRCDVVVLTRSSRLVVCLITRRQDVAALDAMFDGRSDCD